MFLRELQDSQTPDDDNFAKVFTGLIPLNSLTGLIPLKSLDVGWGPKSVSAFTIR